jgi:hypothetical protein
VWCVVCGVWCVVCGVWCVVCGVWCVCVVWCGVNETNLIERTSNDNIEIWVKAESRLLRKGKSEEVGEVNATGKWKDVQSVVVGLEVGCEECDMG